MTTRSAGSTSASRQTTMTGGAVLEACRAVRAELGGAPGVRGDARSIDPTTTYRVQELSLQPDDRLVLLTDGMLERNAAGDANYP